MGEVLVIGATGRQGGATARFLIEVGEPVRALVRDADSDRARQLDSAGCRLVTGDLDDKDSLERAVHGVDRLFLALPLTRPEEEECWGRAVIDTAAAAGVGHLVYSTALDTGQETGVGHFDSKYRLRRHLAGSSLGHTVLEPGGFMENLLFERTWQGLSRGRLVTPWRADTVQPLVAVDDIGRFAAACLCAERSPTGRVLPVYSECLSAADQARIVGEVLGKPVKARKLPDLLVRLLLGRDLYRMFRFYNAGRAPASPDNSAFLQAVPEPITFRRWIEDRIGRDRRSQH